MRKIIILSALLVIPFLAFSQFNRLRYNSNGNFKIVQITDVHYKPGVPASDTAIILIKEMLKSEKPDIVVFTGDLAWDKPTKDCFDKVLEPVIKNKTLWTFVFGNHDDEHGWSRKQIMDYLITKPYCLAQHGDKDLKGEGNYILELYESKPDSIDNIANLFYFFDSGSYKSKIPGVGWSYDWLDFEQVDWYRKQSKAYTKENGGQPIPALAFFHIPLFEYAVMKADPKSIIIGNKDEKECNGKLNTGMFAAMRLAGDVMGTFVGHDHNNDYIGEYYGIALAYGRYSGGNTVYNDLGLNGCRVINLTEGRKGFSTYIRLRGGDKILPVEFPESFPKPEKKN